MSKTYEAMQKTHSSSPSQWNYLDLKNKKQTGDIEKKITHYKQKNNSIFNITSSRRKEGVSTVIANLARYLELQKNDKNILILDANFQNPSLHKVFRLSRTNGLASLLEGTASLADTVENIASTNLHILPSGNDCKNLAGNIVQNKFSAILAEARQNYDIIIIDSAPILTSSDALITAVCADITFLVLQSMNIPREVALRSKLALEDNECTIGGVALNRYRQTIPGWVYNFF